MKHMSIFMRLMLIGVAILLFCTIFLLSSQPATQSNQLSRTVASHLLAFIQNWTSSDLSLTEFNNLLRKVAHFSLFCFLAMIMMLIGIVSKWSWKLTIWISLLVSVVYAIIDESHQWFVDGRGASVKDVFIDSSGALLGIIVIYIIGRRWKK